MSEAKCQEASSADNPFHCTNHCTAAPDPFLIIRLAYIASGVSSCAASTPCNQLGI